MNPLFQAYTEMYFASLAYWVELWGNLTYGEKNERKDLYSVDDDPPRVDNPRDGVLPGTQGR